MQITLKVDVDTLRGTLEGVPALLKIFSQYNVKATFLFSMGPDNTGRALRRVFRKGFLSKVKRTSVTSHYGIKTLLYGVLIPGPNITEKAGHIMKQVLAEGHEVGVHCYDHVKWQDHVANKDAEWTQIEMQKAYDAFKDCLEIPPTTIGAAGWQINQYALAMEENLGFCYASDVRGTDPFYPMLGDRSSKCVQLPTTLPTLDELIGLKGITENNVDAAVFRASRKVHHYGHVFTLHAELEGMKLLPVMDQLLKKWTDAGDSLGTMSDLYHSLDHDSISQKEIRFGSIEGRAGTLALC